MMSHPAGLFGFLSHSLDIKIEIKKRFDDLLEVKWTGHESTTGSPRTWVSFPRIKLFRFCLFVCLFVFTSGYMVFEAIVPL